MKIGGEIVCSALLMALILSCFENDAQAYLDPGTGSYVLQIVLASLVGAALSLKAYWKGIKKHFLSRSSKKEYHPEDRE